VDGLKLILTNSAAPKTKERGGAMDYPVSSLPWWQTHCLGDVRRRINSVLLLVLTCPGADRCDRQIAARQNERSADSAERFKISSVVFSYRAAALALAIAIAVVAFTAAIASGTLPYDVMVGTDVCLNSQ
jgi:hypothetical protein